MNKIFLSPKFKTWFAPMFFSGLFGGFLRSGFAAPFAFWRGFAAPKARWVRTNSSILHQKGNCKSEPTASLRSAAKTYCSFGLNSNARFRILGTGKFYEFHYPLSTTV